MLSVATLKKKKAKARLMRISKPAVALKLNKILIFA